MFQPDHYFVTDGSSETGNYKIIEVKDGKITELHPVRGNKLNGLKEARIRIGEYILNKYNFPSETPLPHRCLKPGRKYNPWNKWVVGQYYSLK